MDTAVLFIVFNRPDTTKISFDAIRKTKPKKYLLADGTRKGNKDDIENLANAIEYLLLNTEEREKLAEKAYHYAINRFSNKNIKENLLNAYKSVMNTYHSEK